MPGWLHTSATRHGWRCVAPRHRPGIEMKAPQAIWPVARGLELVSGRGGAPSYDGEALVREQGSVAATNNGAEVAETLLCCAVNPVVAPPHWRSQHTTFRRPCLASRITRR